MPLESFHHWIWHLRKRFAGACTLAQRPGDWQQAHTQCVCQAQLTTSYTRMGACTLTTSNARMGACTLTTSNARMGRRRGIGGHHQAHDAHRMTTGMVAWGMLDFEEGYKKVPPLPLKPPPPPAPAPTPAPPPLVPARHVRSAWAKPPAAYLLQDAVAVLCFPTRRRAPCCSFLDEGCESTIQPSA